MPSLATMTDADVDEFNSNFGKILARFHGAVAAAHSGIVPFPFDIVHCTLIPPSALPSFSGFLSGLMDPRLHHHHFAAAHAAAAAAAAAAAHHPQQPQPVPPHTPHPPQPLAPAAAHHVPPQQPAPPPPTGSGFPWSGPSSQTATGKGSRLSMMTIRSR